jgi:hypothetical protein
MAARIWLGGILLGLMLSAATPAPVLATSYGVDFIDPETLQGMLGDPQVLILDVRTQYRWTRSKEKIPGAVRHHPGRIAKWGPTLPRDQKIVLY